MRAIYAGSFDPITNGHLNIIKTAMNVFSELNIVIANNPNKSNCLLSTDERQFAIKLAIQELMPEQEHQIFVRTLDHKELLVDYAKKLNTKYLVRGIRSQMDFDHELTMHRINEDLAPDITTIFLASPKEYSEVSSSYIKSVQHLNKGHEITKKHVPSTVYAYLKHKKIINCLIKIFFDLIKNELTDIYDYKAKDEKALMMAHLFIARIIIKYCEPHRHYHNFDHISSCLQECYIYDENMIDHNIDRILSLLYHDIIYDPMANNNEEKSAEYFDNDMKMLLKRNYSVNTKLINSIKKAILETKSHKPTSKLSKEVSDIDMSVLSYEKDELQEYDKNIRKEYSMIPDEIFYPKRIEFLKSMKKQKIFYGDYYKHKEEKAQQNIDILIGYNETAMNKGE